MWSIKRIKDGFIEYKRKSHWEAIVIELFNGMEQWTVIWLNGAI